ncbi:hypothetical protein [Rhizobium sp. BK176]|uniref:hypothetical protein n=1 Tax=Rhizobium sp. BK176 TaxID=2587071 RepID=UPI002166D4B3|nr:hypothetical protein [Rhizobium sp. BK176]MCS4089083.1 hypothetical protein [Rhizobium sp. BK176]
MIVKFPVLLPSALPPRHKTPRPAVVLREADIVVPHLSRTHLSEIATVKYTRHREIVTTNFLGWNNRAFIHRSDDLLKFLDELVNPAEPFLTWAHWDELRDNLSALRDRRRVWPEDFGARLRSGVHDLDVEAMSAEVRTVPDGDLALYTDHWKRRFEEYLASFVVVDGHIWCETSLPQIVVTLRQRSVVLYLENSETDWRSRRNWHGAEDYLFPLTALDAAIKFASDLSSEFGSQPSIDQELAVLDMEPFSVSEGYEERELLRVAGILASTILNTLKKERGVDDLLAMAKQLRHLSNARDNTVDADAVEDLMSSMLSICRHPNPQLGRYPCERYLQRHFERHFERWVNRPLRAPISLSAPDPS